MDAGSKFLKAGFAIPDQTPAMVLFFTFLNCKTGTPPKKKRVQIWSFLAVLPQFV